MDYRDILAKDKNRFAQVNENVNMLIDKYGMNTVKKIIRGILNEEDAQQQQAPAQPAQQQQGQEQNAQQQPQVDTQKMMQEFGQIGEQFKKFCEAYKASPIGKELEEMLKNMMGLSDKIKQSQAQQPAQQQAQAQQQQAPAQPAQQQQAQAQPAQ